MATLHTDSLNRANETPVASPWEKPTALAAMRIVDNALTVTTDGADSGAYYNVATPDGQWAKITLVSTANVQGAITRLTNSASANFYLAHVAAGGAYINFAKFVDGSYSNPAAYEIPGGIQIGDEIQLDSEGTTHRVYYNGALVITETDASHSSGFTGVFGVQAATAIDAFAMGDFSAADTTAPSFTDGPDVTAVADTTATIGATADESGFAAFIADTPASSQPSDGSFDAVAAAIVATTPFTTNLTSLTAATLYKVWNQLKDAVPNRRTASSMLLTSHTGASSRVTLASINADPDLRITAVPDLEVGMILEITEIDGAGEVTLFDDGTFYAEPGAVDRFFVVGGNLTDGWGLGGWQTLTSEPEPEVPSDYVSAWWRSRPRGRVRGRR